MRIDQGCQDSKNIPVDIVHTEGLDPMLSQDLLLATIHITQTNVYQLARADNVLILQPAKNVGTIFPGQTGQEGHGHAVNVAAGAHLGQVDIGMRIHPDDRHLTTQTLTDGLGGTGDRSDRDGVIASESQHKLAVLGVLVDLRAETLGDRTDGARLLHAPVVGVLGRDVVFIVVDGVVVVDLVVEVVAQLSKQTGLNQGHWRGLDTLFHLEAATRLAPRGAVWLTFSSNPLTCPPLKPTATTPS